MVIDNYKPRVGVLPFSGLFVCEDPEGNRLLRSLEPPRHDKWDPKRAEEAEAALAYEELREWIRDEIRKLIPHVDEDQFNETALPSDLMENEPENPAVDGQDESVEPDLSGRADHTSPILPLNPRASQVRRRSQRNGGAGGEGDEVEEPEEGDEKNTGGRKRRKGGRGEGGSEPKPPFVQSRAFCDSEDQKTYEIVLRAESDYSGDVWIDAIGDDGSADEVVLESAVGDGSPLEIERSKIKSVVLHKGQPHRIRVSLLRSGKYSLRPSFS
jgi:hypothetical protein